MNNQQYLFSHPLEATVLDEMLKAINFKEQLRENYILFEEKKTP